MRSRLAVCLQLTANGSLEMRTGYGIAHMKKSSVYTCKEFSGFICRLLRFNSTGFEKYIYKSNLLDYNPVYKLKFMY